MCARIEWYGNWAALTGKNIIYGSYILFIISNYDNSNLILEAIKYNRENEYFYQLVYFFLFYC